MNSTSIFGFQMKCYMNSTVNNGLLNISSTAVVLGTFNSTESNPGIWCYADFNNPSASANLTWNLEGS